MTASFLRAFLSFDGEDDVVLQRMAVLVMNDIFVGRFTVSLGTGLVPWGTLDEPKQETKIRPGFLGVAGLSWRVLDDEGDLPYVVLNASLGGLHAPVERNEERGTYFGLDFRFGATLGKTFGGWFSPYASVRTFGGPIFWTEGNSERVGTDKYHFQGALGAVFVLPESVDIFVEGQPGAEMGAAAGFGVRY